MQKKSETHFLYYLIVLFLLTGIVSCNNIERMDTAKMKELVESSEIKRITSAELTNTVNRLGSQLADSLDDALGTQSVVPCDFAEDDIVRSFAEKNQVKIRFLTQKDTASVALYDKEREVLLAYSYNTENGLRIEPNIQKVGDSLLVYTSPASAGLRYADNCPTKEIGPLKVWSIVFPVGEVIKQVGK